MPGASGKTYAIHPAIGVARLGNADADFSYPSSYYLGAESPLQVPNAGQPYKTGGKIKKQAQRYRVYEFQGGQATREVTLQEEDIAAIEWTVHLCNRKSALDTSAKAGTKSAPGVVPPSYGPAKTRNATVSEDDRGELCIDPGRQSVGGAGDQERELSATITFSPEPNQPKTRAVTLGKLGAEAGSGRLLVLPGNGLSEGLLEGSFSPLAELADWRNNDAWYDDTADGWVRAEITFRDGTVVSLDQPEQSAWVITAVPRFAPGLNGFTTLYDVAMDALHTPAHPVPRPSFAKDIYPILRSVSLLQWISARASVGHGTGKGGYYLAQERMRLVSDNNPSPDSDAYKARQAVFGRIRNPEHEDVKQENMPQLPTQVMEDPGRDWDISAVTVLQYALLKRWRDGDFEPEAAPEYVPLDELDVRLQPAALDRAALESTAGTPFYPGIESWRITRDRDLYSDSPLRMSSGVTPGDLTIGNALPWQADFLDCIDAWWPVQRPSQVTREGEPLQPWVPPDWKENDETPVYSKMVQNWSGLGFVVSENDGASYEEVERSLGEPGA